MSELGTVAVTGATGFVGRYVVRTLLARGARVRALTRDRQKAQAVLPQHPHLTLVPGQVLDRTAPAELLRGCQACVNLIGIIREAGKQTFEGAHVQSVRALVDAATDAGGLRFVHISALGVTPDGKAAYQRTKFAGEQIIRKSALPWTILRPGLIHGPEGELVRMIADWTAGRAAPWFFVPYFTRIVEHDEGVPAGRVSFESAKIAPVSVVDVAETVARCLERPQTVGEVYNLTGPDVMDWRQMLEIFADHLPDADSTLPIIGLPARPHAHMAAAASRIGLGGIFPFDAGQAYMAEEDAVADLDKVRADLGLEPRPFEPLVKQYAGALSTLPH